MFKNFLQEIMKKRITFYSWGMAFGLCLSSFFKKSNAFNLTIVILESLFYIYILCSDD